MYKQSTWEEMLAKAKEQWTWELAVASSNLQLNLYNLRKHKGWTQTELAKQIGVAHPHIVRHETQGYMPSMDSLAKYAHVYGVSVSDLLGEPMHFGPTPMLVWSDQQREYVEIGTVEAVSSAVTHTEVIDLAKWSFAA